VIERHGICRELRGLDLVEGNALLGSTLSSIAWRVSEVNAPG
jgi:hypothetical protein